MANHQPGIVELSFQPRQKQPEKQPQQVKPVWRRPMSAKARNAQQNQQISRAKQKQKVPINQNHSQVPVGRVSREFKVNESEGVDLDDPIWDDPLESQESINERDRAVHAHLKRMEAARKKAADRVPDNAFDRSQWDREFHRGEDGDKDKTKKTSKNKAKSKAMAMRPRNAMKMKSDDGDADTDTDLRLRAAFIQSELDRLHTEHRKTLRQKILEEKRASVRKELEEFESRLQGHLTEKIANLMGERDDRLKEAETFQAELREKIAHLQAMDGDVSKKISSMELAFKRNVIALEDEYARKVNDERERLICKLDGLEHSVDAEVEAAERLSMSMTSFSKGGDGQLAE